MADEPTILKRLLDAIADSEHDHPGDDRYIVDLSRKDAMDAVSRIVTLRSQLSEFATALSDVAPDHPILKVTYPDEPKG